MSTTPNVAHVTRQLETIATTLFPLREYIINKSPGTPSPPLPSPPIPPSCLRAFPCLDSVPGVLFFLAFSLSPRKHHTTKGVHSILLKASVQDRPGMSGASASCSYIWPLRTPELAG